MRIDNEGLRTFQELPIPGGARLAGWAVLVRALGVKSPVPRPGCVSAKLVSGSSRDERGWRVFDKRHWPGDNFGDHLNFALRNENLDLLIRYLYELWTGRKLNVPGHLALQSLPR